MAGGSGQIGHALARDWQARGHEVVVLARGPTVPSGTKRVAWDGENVGPWCEALEGCDVVVNLAGRSVNCRYSKKNLDAMLRSRVVSTTVMGEAIARCSAPPKVWLQMSTATIYAHRFDAPNDEVTGIIGGHEHDAPAHWKRSIEIATAWENALTAAPTSNSATRRVALRTSMVMAPDRDGIFDTLMGLVRGGLGGSMKGGRQYMSWIHVHDFVAALDFIVAHKELDGVVNVCSPNPIPQRTFMAVLRKAARCRVGFSATGWMAAIGAFFMRTETELLFKSRRVVPKRLLDAGFSFAFPHWEQAAQDLVHQLRARTS